MTYCTLQQLTDRFGEKMLRQLTDRATPAAGAIDEAVVDRALADADATINGYLAGRYKLPLEETPALVADIAQSITIYKLHGSVVAEKIDTDYQDAIRRLREIASGVVRLDVAGVEPASSGTEGVRVTDREREMTPENLKGFM